MLKQKTRNTCIALLLIVLRLAVQEDATGGTQSAVDAFNASQDKYDIV